MTPNDLAVLAMHELLRGNDEQAIALAVRARNVSVHEDYSRYERLWYFVRMIAWGRRVPRALARAQKCTNEKKRKHWIYEAVRCEQSAVSLLAHLDATFVPYQVQLPDTMKWGDEDLDEKGE